MVTDFSDGVVVGHIGGIVARLVDGHASELLDGAVQLEPALIIEGESLSCFIYVLSFQAV